MPDSSWGRRRCRGVALSALIGVVGCGGSDADAPSGEGEWQFHAAERDPVLEAAQASFYQLDRRVEIEVELSPEDWERLRAEGRSVIDTLLEPNGPYEYTYFSADVTIDGQLYEDVSIRKKGYLGSLSIERPSLKIDLEREGRGLSHLGLEEITLNNERQDPSHSHECLAYGSFAAAGIPAPRCGLAHVVVNGEDLGTYGNIEAMGKAFLRRHFADAEGNLYEGQLADLVPEQLDLLQLKTNEAENDRSDVARLVHALDGDDAGLVARLSAVIDLGEFRTFWALETLLKHWDGYAGNTNNYYLYHDPSSARFVFLPWGTDGAFQRNPFEFLNTSIAVFARGRIANRLYALPGERQAFRERLAELADSVWVEERLNAELDRIEQLAVDASPVAIAEQRELIATHAAALRAELARPPRNWINAPPLRPDACGGRPGEIRGSFSTRWGRLAPGAGTSSVQATIDGERVEGSGMAAAGFDPTVDDGVPHLRLTAPLSDTATLSVDLELTPKALQAGIAPFHGLERVGSAQVVDATRRFAPGGFISDGAIEFDAASMEAGAPVTGRFVGRLLQFGCFMR